MKVRVAVVGLGMMGTTHFKAYREIPEAELVAVCDVDARKLAGDWSGAAGNIDTGAAQRTDLSGLRAYADFGDLLKDKGVDAVDICLPTFLHAPMAIRALKARKHVICEKPMARTAREARQMVKTAARKNRFLGVAHVLRFWPEYLAMKEMMDSGRYGRIRSAYFGRFSSRPMWSWENWLQDAARSGSAVLDLHVHDTDMVQWFFGRPLKVTAAGTFDADGGASHILATFHYEKGPMVVVEGGWDFPPSFPFRMSARVVFESAAVEFNTLRAPTLAVHDARTGKAEYPAMPAVNGYTEELRYFIGCIASGQPPARVPPADAAASVAVVEAEVKSALTGKTVKVRL
jgi:predicted dehydrogenase